MKLSIRCLFFIGLLWSSFHSVAGQVSPDFSPPINTTKPYVFYSHGFIVEGEDPKPMHPRWGVYDFPAVTQALASDAYHLIAYHREKNSDPFAHVKMLTAHAKTLLTKGVKPSDIYFVGFSRGGGITALVSNELANPEVNYVILAGCSGLIKSQEQAKLYGKVFSIREKTDKVGSCGFLLNRGGEVSYFRELMINTGLEHGAFYRPIKEWLVPVRKHLHKR